MERCRKRRPEKGFVRQIQLAKKYDKPILIHMREATKDTLDILQEYAPHKGIFHCLAAAGSNVNIVLNMGFHIAYGGPLTFKIPEVLLKCVNKFHLIDFL